MKNNFLFIIMVIAMVATFVLSLVIIMVPTKLIAISILFSCVVVVVLGCVYYKH